MVANTFTSTLLLTYTETRSINCNNIRCHDVGLGSSLPRVEYWRPVDIIRNSTSHQLFRVDGSVFTLEIVLEGENICECTVEIRQTNYNCILELNGESKFGIGASNTKLWFGQSMENTVADWESKTTAIGSFFHQYSMPWTLYWAHFPLTCLLRGPTINYPSTAAGSLIQGPWLWMHSQYLGPKWHLICFLHFV